MSSPQGKYWCFTWNNPGVDYIDAAKSFTDLADFGYLIFQLERASTLHFQGYVEFNKLKRLNQLKRSHPTLHFERRKGSQQEAIDYCKKGDTAMLGPWEHGTPASLAQGARNDLSAGVETIKSSGIRGLAQEHPELLVKYPRGFLLLNSLNKPNKPVPEVYLYFGPPDCGKSRSFYDKESPNDQWQSPVTDGLWFDGYYGQDAALFDDFDGRFSKVPLAIFLRIIDRYDVSIPCKGGFLWFTPKRIYITSNYYPRDWYDWTQRQQQYPALRRRFTRVFWWKSVGTLPVVISRPDLELSEDVTSEPDQWDHFWGGRDLAQLGLDQVSGRLVSNAPAEYFNF